MKKGQVPCLQRENNLSPPTAYLGYLDPVLKHCGPVFGLHALVPEAGRYDHVSHPIKVCNGGTDSGRQMFPALLVPLGPDGAQAVQRHHLFE